MQLHRVVIAWSGTPIIGSAVTVLHYDGSNQTAPPVGSLKTAFQSNGANILPSSVTLTIPNTGDTIEDTTGDLVSVWSGTGGGTVTGTVGGAVAAGVGACIGWQTGGVVAGRRLRGRTFLVPLPVTAYETDGTFNTVYQTALGTLANAIQATGPLAVWHRPTSATATDGTSYGVLSNRVRDKVAFLSSRRD